MIGWRSATERALYGAPGQRPLPGGPGPTDAVPVPAVPSDGTPREGRADEPAPARADEPTRGFFHRPEGPTGHFRTSVNISQRFPLAVGELLRLVDEALDHPNVLDVVDMGAGGGELLHGLLRSVDPGLTARLRCHAVDLADRPKGLDDRVIWGHQLPQRVTGLVFANEWLDNVPVDIAQADDHGVPRLVLVDGTGQERLGDPVAGEDAAWLARWWPLRSPGLRAEIGSPRDLAWTAAVRSVRRGLAVAVDYAHTRDNRPPFGTLTGYRQGRQVPPVPDGSCDITSHVALDACAAAAGHLATSTMLTDQRTVLRALGVRGDRPPLALAHRDPAGYVRALSAAGEAAELTEPGGLGSFTWLLQGKGMAPPIRFSG